MKMFKIKLNEMFNTSSEIRNENFSKIKMKLIFLKLKVNSFEISNQIEFGHNNNKMDLVSNIKNRHDKFDSSLLL